MVAFALMVLLSLSVLLIDVLIPRKRVEIASSIYIGLLIGVLLAYLFNLALRPLFAMSELFGNEGAAFQGGATLISLLILPYLCISFLLQTKDDFRFVIPYVEFSRELKGGRPLILDSSALIDGRIADVVDTNMVDAQLIVPQFILQEVQDIADSHDKVRRSRGRRGLDVLKKLQSDPKVEVRILESDNSVKGKSVDQRLIEISKQHNGRLVTNDLNLNKLAGVQGVAVINLNDVSNALKPRFIPGRARADSRSSRKGRRPGRGSAIWTTARWSSWSREAATSARTSTPSSPASCRTAPGECSSAALPWKSSECRRSAPTGLREPLRRARATRIAGRDRSLGPLAGGAFDLRALDGHGRDGARNDAAGS